MVIPCSRVQCAISDGSERSPRQTVSIGKSGIGIRAKGFSGDNDAFWVSLSGDFQKATEGQSQDHKEQQKCHEDQEKTSPERPVEVPAKECIGRVDILINVGGEKAKHLVGAVLVPFDRFDGELQALIERVFIIGRLAIDGTIRTGNILNVSSYVALPELAGAGLLVWSHRPPSIGSSLRSVNNVILRTSYVTGTRCHYT
mmetsp:Transcript_16948/g.48688  ORF Transcript_16948/g.48688 Transcript_16948/m.48688 type:complete len:200 (+) Transcript_16948:2718-3317(+)